MKVTYLHQHFALPSMGRGTRSYEMSTRLSERGTTIEVIAGRRIDCSVDLSYQSLPFRVHEVDADYSQSLHTAARLTSFDGYACRASALGRRIQSDLVLATSTPLSVALPGIALSTYWRAPFIFEVRDLWPAVPRAMGGVPKGADALASVLEYTAYNHASAVICLSKDVADILVRRRLNARIELIPNICDIDLFRGTQSKDPLAPIAELRDRPVLLYAGTLGKVNNPEYLVDLANELRFLRSDIAVVVIGSGSETGKAVKQACHLGLYGRQIFFLPRLPKHSLAAAVTSSTAVISTVLPIKELEWNSANKVFDGFAAGKPVVVNHGGWLSTVITANSAGIRVSPTDVRSAANRVDQLLSSDDDVNAMAANSAALANQRFNRDALGDQLYELLNDLRR